MEDVNEYNPEWLQKSYQAEASEGQLFTRLVQLQAVDRDGYQGSSKICHYHVMTPDVPFEVDGDGEGLSSFFVLLGFRLSICAFSVGQVLAVGLTIFQTGSILSNLVYVTFKAVQIYVSDNKEV